MTHRFWLCRLAASFCQYIQTCQSRRLEEVVQRGGCYNMHGNFSKAITIYPLYVKNCY